MPIYLELTGIPGESTNNLHPHTFELISFSWGANNQVVSSSTGGHRAILLDITVMMRWSLNVPKLFVDCIDGQKISKANIYYTITSNEAEYDVEKLLFTNVVMTSFSNSGAGGNDLPAVQLTFDYEVVEVVAQELNPAGGFNTVQVEWNSSGLVG